MFESVSVTALAVLAFAGVLIFLMAKSGPEGEARSAVAEEARRLGEVWRRALVSIGAATPTIWMIVHVASGNDRVPVSENILGFPIAFLPTFLLFFAVALVVRRLFRRYPSKLARVKIAAWMTTLGAGAPVTGFWCWFVLWEISRIGVGYEPGDGQAILLMLPALAAGFVFGIVGLAIGAVLLMRDS